MLSHAQDKSTLLDESTLASEKKYSIEEIFVSARKREESLSDIPVSISVIGLDLINGAGITAQRDLFQITPGAHYDEGFDRNAALPSIRGVQSNENATNRTKVTAFIDGMPILGSQGSISFENVQQVEVYRGPQSAAFGRSTFGGAINYVTKNPGGKFEGLVSVDINDFGREIITASVAGPATETLSYLIEGTWEDSDSPDEYTATDGTEYGSRSGKAVFGKLIYYPTSSTEVQISYSHVETDDAPTTTYFISGEARNACFDGTTANLGGGLSVYGTGVISCDWSQGSQIQAQNDRTALLIANGEVNEDRLFLASAQSLADGDVGGFDERDRLSVKVDYTLDNDHLIQFLGFKGEENYIRNFDTSFNASAEIGILFGPNVGLWRFNNGTNAIIRGISSDPTEIEEAYAEVRFVSPIENRLRYVIGGSYYSYDFLTEIYSNGYNAVLMGEEAVARYDLLLGNDLLGISVSDPFQRLGEEAKNASVFFNLSYDINPKAIISIEGRFQSDKVTAVDESSGASGSVKTQTFLPRISFTYEVAKHASAYAQIAKGNNPAGVNVGFFDPDIEQSIEDSEFASFTPDTFKFYEEEILINYEIGIKGSTANGRLQYTLAAYVMDWQDQVTSANLSWGDPNGGPDMDTTNRTSINEGDIDLGGIELESIFSIDKHWQLRSTLSYIDATYGDSCAASLVGTGLDSNPELLETAETSGRSFDCYNITGNTVVEQPKLSMSLSPSFDIKLSKSGVRFTARTDVIYEGREFLDLANTAEKESVATANVSMGFTNNNWSAIFYINNITDNNTPLSIDAATDYTLERDMSIGPIAISNYLITPRSPRTIGFRGMIKF